ncbi:hypothetical protein JXB41_08065 [Candidatus Woesearchaeota archaeon]|nr:hypothetical protein [Candidatus Woesearchaeota archaeon]
MKDDDYELLPHEEIDRLKHEIERLKKSPGPDSAALVNSMDSLSQSMNSLLGLFRQAADEMKLDEHDSVMLADKITPLIEKIDKVLEQNEKIARGIVAIADMIEDMQSRPRGSPSSQPAPSYNRFTQAQYNPPQPRAPSPMPPRYPEAQPKPLPSMPAPQEKEEKKPFFKLKF